MRGAEEGIGRRGREQVGRGKRRRREEHVRGGGRGDGGRMTYAKAMAKKKPQEFAYLSSDLSSL